MYPPREFSTDAEIQARPKRRDKGLMVDQEERRNNNKKPSNVINATSHTPVQKYSPTACASLSTSRGQNSRNNYLLGCLTKNALKCIPAAKSIAQFKIGKINYLLVHI